MSVSRPQVKHKSDYQILRRMTILRNFLQDSYRNSARGGHFHHEPIEEEDEVYPVS